MNTSLKTGWDLTLLYASPEDPQIEKDLKAFERACASFARKYSIEKKFLSKEKALADALIEYEKLYAMPEGGRPAVYFYFKTELDAADNKSEARLNQISERLSKASNLIIFFDLELGKIPVKQQQIFLKSKLLASQRYFLKRLFDTAKYNLTEPEEKILNLVYQTGQNLWVQGQDKLLNQQTIEYKGKTLPIPAAFNMISSLGVKERREVHNLVMEKLKSISFFAESELTAIYTDKKIRDELRGFKQPYSATILSYQNDEKNIITFADTVTKHFSISHRFYALKAKLAKLDRLEYADRAAKVGSFNKEFTFEHSTEILMKSFDKLDPEFSSILGTYLERGQIDVFSKKGKTGGAYCAGNTGLPTFVLLNHANNLDSVKTYAHEMGHAIHTEFSKTQPILYENYTISVAEVASTLFENFIFQEIFDSLTEEQKIIALHDRLNDFVATIFRQIACFNYERELHATLRAEGALSKEKMAELHNKHMKAYLGPLFDMHEDDGYFFVYWTHLRRFFYVYSYAYGALISSALYRRYREDKTYIEKIKQFLRAGGSMTPEQIFKSIGIDTSSPDFFEEGLQMLLEDIKKLEKLIRNK
jgi:oligoendopeptidase F